MNSGLFNEFYLVVPKTYCGEDVCGKVIASYGNYLRSLGIGLICIDASGTIEVTIRLGCAPASTGIQQYLTHNTEGFLKQLLINHLRSKGYLVFTEVYVPKPLRSSAGIRTHSTKCYTPAAWLNRIDLVATDCPNGVCSYVGCCKDECPGIIGIEVKLKGVLVLFLGLGLLRFLWVSSCFECY